MSSLTFQGGCNCNQAASEEEEEEEEEEREEERMAWARAASVAKRVAAV